MPNRTPTQDAVRRNVEAILRLAAPALDLVLWTGDRIARVAGRNDLAPDPPRRLGAAGRTPIGGPPAGD